jgi:hypothetical protein
MLCMPFTHYKTTPQLATLDPARISALSSIGDITSFSPLLQGFSWIFLSSF